MRMKKRNREVLVIVFAGMMFGFLSLLTATGFSAEDREASSKIKVGATELPPVCFKATAGEWKGLGVEVWRAIAREMGVAFEFREYEDLGSLLGALERGEIDVVPSLPAEHRYEVSMDLSQSYYKSGLAIAVPMRRDNHRWIWVVAKIFSKDILEPVGLLFLLCLTAGTGVYVFERGGKKGSVGEGAIKSIGHGIWWSIVTMTTVGYGDKTPKTTGGRIVATLWMVFSIVFIAGFTANITSSLTVGQLQGRVRGFDDLYQARVGSISNSEASNYMAGRGIAAISFHSPKEGLNALAEKKIDAFVLNKLILELLAKTEFPGQVQVLPGIFDEYFVAVALKNNSALREPVNRALLKTMETEAWRALLDRYGRSGGE